MGANYLANNAGTWTTSNKFAENGFSYDLNGNITALTRTDLNGATMDALTYDYTGQGNAGNQLHAVTDAGNMINGFVDGNVAGDDYAYDMNGNMITDKNKNITTITYNYLNLPQQVTKGTGEKMLYSYDASGRKLRQQVYNSSGTLTKNTDYDNEFIYQGNLLGDTLKFINHEEGRIVMTGATPEYQYHLKDHLGNVRTTFTTQPTTDSPIATFETANQSTEQSEFLQYDEVRTVNATLFDHTNNGLTSYSERLSGSANEKVGVARSISVMPGDIINLSVYDKYVDPTNNNNTAALTQFLAQVVAGTASAGTVIDGANYSSNGIMPFPYAGLAGEGSSTGTGPKAYLNYLVFDRNFVFLNGGYVQVSTAAKEDGTNVPFEKLTAPPIVISQPGYVYTYLSNEATSPIEVYFDDFTVQQIKSPIVQQEDFYPFGLSFNSYSREGALPNTLKLFQNQEHVDDLGLNWDQFKWRNHQPDIGRFFNVDKLADKYYYNSPYAFSENKVVAHVELEGLESSPIFDKSPLGEDGATKTGIKFNFYLKDKDDKIKGTRLEVEFTGTGTNGVPLTLQSKPEEETNSQGTNPTMNFPSQSNSKAAPSSSAGPNGAGQLKANLQKIVGKAVPKPQAKISSSLKLPSYKAPSMRSNSKAPEAKKESKSQDGKDGK